MNTIDALSKRGATALGMARDAVDAASPKLKSWLKTGAALGVARAGTRVASGVVRRNPGLALAAAVVGAGYLAYTAYRKHAAAAAITNAQADNAAPIDATATVIETRNRRASSERKPTAKAATAAKTKVTSSAPRKRTRKSSGGA